MMTALLAAIKAKFTTAGLATTITGGLHFAEAPPGTSMPYAVVNPVVAPATSRYGAVAFTLPQFDFVVRAVGAADSLALIESLHAAFDEQLLTLASGQMFYTQRLGDPMPEPTDPTQDERGRDSFGWIVSYQFGTR